MRRIIIILAVIGLFAAFFALGGEHYLTLDALHARVETLVALKNASPVRFAAIFFAAYVLVAAFSLPGATIVTLATGAIFGLAEGVVLASFASSIGASLAFLMSRTVLRNWVRERFSERTSSIDDGVKRQGAFYLFSIRLVPLFPFFVVNLLFGLTAMRLRTFYWVSQLGMLAGTIVFVNAGRQLAQIRSLSDVLSPGLIGSFLLLAVFPWLAKATLALVRHRRIYARWRRPRQFDRNLIVIGAGSAGLVASNIAATIGAKVTLVESGKMGGDCLNTGCVPSKALIRSARIAHLVRDARRYGINVSGSTVDFGVVMRRISDVIAAIEPHDSVERYEQLGVDVVRGRATILDPWTVEIADDQGVTKSLTARAMVIATGGAPTKPAIEGLDDVGYLTSDSLWEALGPLDAIPARITILGGGPIGCEIAQALARLGAAVTLIDHGDRLLSKEDDDVSTLIEMRIAAEGVTILTNAQVIRCENSGDDKRVIAERHGERHEISFDALVVALGRSARLTGFGLETLGIETDKTIGTDAFLQTNIPNIYAAGDVAGPYQFTHVAGHQAWFATINALFGAFKKFKVDYRVIPWTTFVDPEVARVGLSEGEAREKGIAHEVTCYPLDDLDRAITDGETAGFVKVLTPPGKDRILGVTIVGEHAGELLAEFVLAMKHGIGLKKIMGTIHVYPTLAEANRYAAGAWQRNHVPDRLMRWVARFFAWQRG